MPYPTEPVPVSDTVDKSWEATYMASVMKETTEYLETRREHDKSFTAPYLRKMLEEMYDSEGDGWLGKEQLNEMRQAAVINAYEAFLTAWEDELEKEKEKKKDEAP